MEEEIKFMTSLTREEIEEIERAKREANNVRLKELYGCGGTAKHPRLS